MTGADTNLWVTAEHARWYLDRRGSLPRREEAYETLLEFLPPRLDRFLDLGCGDGEVIGRVRMVFPDAAAVGADFSEEMLRRVRERFDRAAGVEIVEHDLERPLDPGWGPFDAVVSAFAIHHVPDARKRALYEEVFGLLRPGGAFLNLEHVDSASPELHEAFLATLDIAPEDDDPSNLLAPVERQLGWLREIGFAHVDCHWKWRELALLAGVRPG
jgi:SAM-dependent methyltransferase